MQAVRLPHTADVPKQQLSPLALKPGLVPAPALRGSIAAQKPALSINVQDGSIGKGKNQGLGTWQPAGAPTAVAAASAWDASPDSCCVKVRYRNVLMLNATQSTSREGGFLPPKNGQHMSYICRKGWHHVTHCPLFSRQPLLSRCQNLTGIAQQPHGSPRRIYVCCQ